MFVLFNQWTLSDFLLSLQSPTKSLSDLWISWLYAITGHLYMLTPLPWSHYPLSLHCQKQFLFLVRGSLRDSSHGIGVSLVPRVWCPSSYASCLICSDYQCISWHGIQLYHTTLPAHTFHYEATIPSHEIALLHQQGHPMSRNGYMPGGERGFSPPPTLPTVAWCRSPSTILSSFTSNWLQANIETVVRGSVLLEVGYGHNTPLRSPFVTNVVSNTNLGCWQVW